jgi:hypothetical protein
VRRRHNSHGLYWHGAEAWRDGSRRFVGRLQELWTLHDALSRTTG